MAEPEGGSVWTARYGCMAIAPISKSTRLLRRWWYRRVLTRSGSNSRTLINTYWKVWWNANSYMTTPTDWVWKWESQSWVTVFLILSALFLVPAAFVPTALKPLYGPWMKIGFFLGVIMTTVLMTILYCIVVPIFSLIRLKDPLRMKLIKDRSASYWEPHKMAEATVERFSKPF